MKKMKITMISTVLLVLNINTAMAETFGPYNVDTGSHTCTSLGQERKVGKVFSSGEDRYFVRSTVTYSTVSRFGGGDCRIMGVKEKDIYLKLETGQSVRVTVPIGYTVRAFADCTRNPAKLGSRIGTECQFTSQTEEYLK